MNKQNEITTINDRQIKVLVDKCIQSMTRIQEATFWKCWCEVHYRVGKPYSETICKIVRNEATLRMDEFEKAWIVNLGQRRLTK